MIIQMLALKDHLNSKINEAVKEFREIYKKEYGDELKDDDAHELAQNLLNVYRIVYKEPPK